MYLPPFFAPFRVVATFCCLFQYFFSVDFDFATPGAVVLLLTLLIRTAPPLLLGTFSRFFFSFLRASRTALSGSSSLVVLSLLPATGATGPSKLVAVASTRCSPLALSRTVFLLKLIWLLRFELVQLHNTIELTKISNTPSLCHLSALGQRNTPRKSSGLRQLRLPPLGLFCSRFIAALGGDDTLCVIHSIWLIYSDRHGPTHPRWVLLFTLNTQDGAHHTKTKAQHGHWRSPQHNILDANARRWGDENRWPGRRRNGIIEQYKLHFSNSIRRGERTSKNGTASIFRVLALALVHFD